MSKAASQMLLAQRLAALSLGGRALLAAHLQAGQASTNPGELRLIAYVVPAPASSVNPAELRDYLSARLPGYMVPSAIVVLDALPLTPNGKLDRQALPHPLSVAAHSHAATGPRNAVEQDLASLWKELLGVGEYSINDDFFELGGHSLLVTRLVAQVRERYNVDVPVASFFQLPTIAGLAEQIAILQWARAELPIEAGHDRDEVEL